MENLGLIPLTNFGEVIPNVYRSAQPLFGYQYDWVKNVLNLNTIVNLRSEKNVDARFCLKRGMNTITFGVKDHFTPTPAMAKEYMDFIKGLKEPVLIHCLHGHGRTSTFSVLTKMAMGMDLHEAIQDEHDRFHYQFRHHNQEVFLESLTK